MFPSPIGAFCAAPPLPLPTRSGDADGPAADATTTAAVARGSLTWNELPWLHGEIFLHRLLPIVYAASADSTMPDAMDETLISPDALARFTAADSCAYCAQAQGAAGALAESPWSTPCAGCAFSVDGHRQTSAPAWDFYRFEKAESLRTTVATHIVPAAAALYTELQAVLSDLQSKGAAAAAAATPTTSDPVGAKVRRLLHAALLNSLWGNCVDLSLHRSSDVASSSNAEASTATLCFDERDVRPPRRQGGAAGGSHPRHRPSFVRSHSRLQPGPLNH